MCNKIFKAVVLRAHLCVRVSSKLKGLQRELHTVVCARVEPRGFWVTFAVQHTASDDKDIITDSVNQTLREINILQIYYIPIVVYNGVL